MKKTIVALLATIICILCVGCGHTHSWQEATCAAPKTCAECGETEGEALPHTLTEATYQSAAACTVCGQTEGKPLEASLADFTFMEEGVKYDYRTFCNDTNDITNATVFVDNYRVVASEEGFEAKEGYEWRMADAHYVFSDQMAQMYGYVYRGTWTNYYNAFEEGSEGEPTRITDAGVVIGSTSIYDMNGTEEKVETRVLEECDGWINNTREVILHLAVQVPIGYDGVVLRYYNIIGADEPAEGVMETPELYKAQESLFFRFD